MDHFWHVFFFNKIFFSCLKFNDLVNKSRANNLDSSGWEKVVHKPKPARTWAAGRGYFVGAFNGIFEENVIQCDLVSPAVCFTHLNKWKKRVENANHEHMKKLENQETEILKIYSSSGVLRVWSCSWIFQPARITISI